MADRRRKDSVNVAVTTHHPLLLAGVGVGATVATAAAATHQPSLNMGAVTDAAHAAYSALVNRDRADNKPAHFRKLDPRRIGTDPATFQFKSGGDQSGVTDRLKGVKTWDPVAAGKAVVYERANGEMVIADGHQRLGLAKRLANDGQHVAMDAYVLRERDGWSPRDVYAYAALKNIKESSGQALDMAKVMRERPDLVNGSVPMTDTKVRDAANLAKLSKPAFDMVVGGAIKPEYAAQVGARVGDTTRHADMLSEMAKANVASATHAGLYVDQALAAGSITEHQSSLFGESTTTRSLIAERAAVLDKALTTLKSDKRIFSLLEREAGTIEGAGNRLSHEANAQRAGEAGNQVELIERLAKNRGPVSDLLEAAARSMAEGNSPQVAARSFVKGVGDALKSGGLAALTGDAAPMKVENDPHQMGLLEDQKPMAKKTTKRAAKSVDIPFDDPAMVTLRDAKARASEAHSSAYEAMKTNTSFLGSMADLSTFGTLSDDEDVAHRAAERADSEVKQAERAVEMRRQELQAEAAKPKAAKRSSSGKRGTQNAANLEAINANKKAKAKGPAMSKESAARAKAAADRIPPAENLLPPNERQKAKSRGGTEQARARATKSRAKTHNDRVASGAKKAPAGEKIKQDLNTEGALSSNYADRERRYINRMKAGDTTKTDAELKADFAAKNASNGSVAERMKAKMAAEPPVNPAIASYNERLNKSLGTPEFAKVHAELSADKSMSVGDIKALAKMFNGASTASKGTNLRKIARRQQALETSIGKRAATAGRIAGALAPIAIGAAMLLSAKQAKAEGRNPVQEALKTGAQGAGTMAGFSVAQGAGTYALIKGAGMTAAKAIPAVNAAMMVGNAAYEAYNAPKGHKLEAAAKGAWDMSIPGMIANTARMVNSLLPETHNIGGRGAARGPRPDFNTANQAFRQRKAPPMASTLPVMSQNSGKKKGWSNSARISAYLAKNPSGANLPYGGDRGMAPTMKKAA